MISNAIKAAVSLMLATAQLFIGTYVAENDPNRPLYTKSELLSVLSEVYESDKVIIGTQTINSADMVSKTLSEYYGASGKYPGILGIDIAAVNLTELGEDGQSRVVSELKSYAQNGGIITVSVHFANPKDKRPYIHNYRGYLGGDEKWAEHVTDGSKLNHPFMVELKLVGDFLEELQAAEIPIIFRPLHEANGNWFWFSTVQNIDGKDIKISEESFRNLWIYIHDYLTQERELTNLIWNFGPNIGKESSWMTPTLYGYPGDEYVDVCGFDWYTNGKSSTVETSPTYKDLKTLGMAINLNEFGPANEVMAKNGESQEELLSCQDILEILEYMNSNGYKLGYAMTWHGPYSGVAMGKLDTLMQSEIAIGQSELFEIFKSK